MPSLQPRISSIDLSYPKPSGLLGRGVWAGFLAALVFAMAACGPFTAELTASAVEGSAPFEVTFTNDGSDADSHEWDFGDGSDAEQTGTSGTATHTYTEAGTFTATLDTASGEETATSSVTITVSPGPLTEINLDDWSGEVEAGTNAPIGAVATDEFGNVIESATLSVEVPGDAGSVSGDSIAAATTAGEFADGLSVTATHNGATVTASADLNIVPSGLDRVEVQPSEIETTPTEVIELTILVLDAHGNEIPDAEVEVSSSSSVGSISGSRFTAARSVGESSEGITVSVTDGDGSETVSVPVTVVPGPLASVEVSPGSYEAEVASSEQFSAVGLDEFGNEIPGLEITWETSSGVGSIDSDGQFTAGTEAGTYESGLSASATENDEAVQESVSVTLLPGEFDQVVIDSGDVTAGQETQLAAYAADEYGNEVEGASLEWTLLDDSAGSLSETGSLVPATVARTYVGAIQVDATLDGEVKSRLVNVVVTPGPLSQVVMMPGSVALGMNVEQQYVAKAGDQYGNPIPEAVLSWESNSSAGSIDGNALFTSSGTPGVYSNGVTVTASHGGNFAMATSTVEVEPDRIMYYTENEREAGQFVLVNPDGTDQTLLNIGAYSAGRYSISPDGRQIAYSEWTLDGGILLLDEEATFPLLLIGNSEDVGYHSPAWSPDGRRIVMVRVDLTTGDRELVLLDIDGGNAEYLTDNSSIQEFAPSWSPDGKFVVYDETPSGGVGDIWSINVETKERKRLTTHTANDTEPVYSPDGSKILFSTSRDGNAEVYIMNADGSGKTNLTNSLHVDARATWSSDGSRILYMSNRDGDPDIYSMNPDGSGVIKISNNTGIDSFPYWMPRRQAVPVNSSALILRNEAGDEETVQALTAKIRESVVRIVTDRGSGSGFVITTGGLILTNNHVIRDASSVTVHMDDGTQHSGTVVGRDLNHDLAVLQIDATGLTPIEFGRIGEDDLGSEVVILGYPLGSSDLNVTRGVVSSLKSDSGTNTSWVQTDAAVNPGNSGGPMINLRGQVVGVVSAALFGSSVENVGYAISTPTVLTYLDRLIAGETIFLN